MVPGKMTGTGIRAGGERYSFRSRLKKYRVLMLFLVPAVVLSLLFSYLPMFGLIMGFKDTVNLLRYPPLEAIFRSEWTLGQFQKLFSDPEFLSVLWNTLLISVLKIVIIFPVPILLAILMFEVRNRVFAKAVQSTVYLPHFLSWAIIVGLFSTVLDPVSGVVNTLLVKLGLEPVYFMGEPALFRGLTVFTALWKEAGWNSIVYMAAIAAIDTSFYEAARIDGAGKVKQILKITIPSIAPTIAVLFIIRLSGLMDAGFEQIQLMMSPTTKSVGNIIGTYVYSIAFASNNFTFSTAVGLFNGVVAMILMAVGNFTVKKLFHYSVW